MVEFLHLPVEVLTLICSLLDTSSKLQLCKTCVFLDNIISSKKLVKCMKLNTVLNFHYNDAMVMVNNNIRCQNITILNINGWYWIPRNDIYRVIKKLVNLQELNAIDTKLQIKDIYMLLGNLNALEFVSFTYFDGKIQSNELQNYGERFRGLNYLVIEFRGSDDVDLYQTFSSEFINYYFMPVRNGRKFCVFYNEDNNILVKVTRQLFSKDYFSVSSPGYHEMLHTFLPDLESNPNHFHKLASSMNMQPLGKLKICVEDVVKLNLYFINYHFKDKNLPNSFYNIRELCISDEQLFDVPNAPRSNESHRFKKQRLGVSESADDEAKQPIRTLAAACPNLEVLCIKKINSTCTTYVWYPCCLKSISLWKNLRVLALINVESKNGAFLKDIAVSCVNLTHLTLRLGGSCGSICIFASDMCEALPYWKKLQYLNIQEIEPRINDLLLAIANCITLRVVIIQINYKLCVKNVSCVLYKDLQHLIANLINLVFIQIIDHQFTKHYANNLERALNKHFSKERKILKIYMDDRRCEERLDPFFLTELDLTSPTYW